MKAVKQAVAVSAICLAAQASWASVDSDFKERPQERFVVYTGDGNYKQAYHWSFNENGTGEPVTIFLNHGSGGEWYDEIDTEFGPCGPDYVNADGDFAGTDYDGLCMVDGEGNEVYLADFEQHHVPVGPDLQDFMLKKIVGSTQFAAWYWQDAFTSQFDSPVHIFMVGRYNIVKDPAHLNNALYWLNATDQNSVSRDTLPPYNFDGYGLADIDGDLRPMHAAPDISGFDNMFLYKAVREQYPEVSLDRVIVEGRSNGGSAMIAMAADYHIWPEHMRDFWSRNLPAEDIPPQEPVQVENVTMQNIMDNPQLLAAFEQMLAGFSEQDLVDVVTNGQTLSLLADNTPIVGTAGEYQAPQVEPEIGGGEFNEVTFETDLAGFIHGDFYSDIKMAHAFYPGCRLDGYMEKDEDLPPGAVGADGDNSIGYQVAIRTMFSFGDEDSLYKQECEDRVVEAAPVTAMSGALSSSDITDGSEAVIGELFSPAQHGFDYKNVYKNLPHRTLDEQARAAESRRAIERVVNQAILEAGFMGSYSLPYDVD